MSSATAAVPPAPRPLRIGFLALTDAAPLVAAQAQGYFAAEGLKVELHREVGWATIRDKILFGELDAAQAPAPMLWAARLGLGGVALPAMTAFIFNLNGNAFTLSTALRQAGVVDAATLRQEARRRRGEGRLTFGVVYPYSSHHLHLRQWLTAAGITPEVDVRIVVVPPAQMFRNLEAGTIDGFWAGEPWPTIAVRAGVGWCPTWSSRHANGHPEKVLMVTERFAASRGDPHARLLRALDAAARWCDRAENRLALAELLAGASYVNQPARVLAPTLVGDFNAGDRRVSVPDFHVFHHEGANVPTAAKAAALQSQLQAAGLLPASVPPDLPAAVFRQDLYTQALHSHHHASPLPSHAITAVAGAA